MFVVMILDFNSTIVFKVMGSIAFSDILYGSL